MKTYRILAYVGLCLGFLLSSAALAQEGVPQEMQYQVMVLNPKTGLVRASEEVQIEFLLRQGSETGQTVWSQTFGVTTDERGMCHLALPFTDRVDWAKGPYYLATVIGGEECGAPKLTAVPYAFFSNRAASLDGCFTKEELVGTWQRRKTNVEQKYTTEVLLVLNADGTGHYKEIGISDSDSYVREEFVFSNWALSGDHLIVFIPDANASEEDVKFWHIYKRTAKEMHFDASGINLTKQ